MLLKLKNQLSEASATSTTSGTEEKNSSATLSIMHKRIKMQIGEAKEENL